MLQTDVCKRAQQQFCGLMILRTHKPNICRKDTEEQRKNIMIWACLAVSGTSRLALSEGRMYPQVYRKKFVDNVCRPAETLQKCGDTTGQWPPNTAAKSASKPQPSRDTIDRLNAVPLLCFYHHFTKAY